MAKGRSNEAKHPLKAWNDAAWQRKLSKTLTVSRVDEDIPTDEQKPNRKPWYIALTQNPELLTRVGGVSGLPEGNTLLLSEDDVVELVRYLFEPQLAMWSENPSPTEPGKQQAYVFVQSGLLDVSESEEIVNGERQWSPDYFTRQTPSDGADGIPPKHHTLPWKLDAALDAKIQQNWTERKSRA
jgi:hypothetical protein